MWFYGKVFHTWRVIPFFLGMKESWVFLVYIVYKSLLAFGFSPESTDVFSELRFRVNYLPWSWKLESTRNVPRKKYMENWILQIRQIYIVNFVKRNMYFPSVKIWAWVLNPLLTALLPHQAYYTLPYVLNFSLQSNLRQRDGWTGKHDEGAGPSK